MKFSKVPLLLALSFVLLLSACTIGGTPFHEVGNLGNNQAVVYLYRPRAIVGGGVLFDVKANGKRLVTLVHTSYYPYIAPPGQTLFTAKTAVNGNETSLVLDIKPGHVYYIRGGTNMMGPGVHLPTLTLVPEAVGSQEIKACVQYEK